MSEEKNISKMNLLEIEHLTSERAAEKGFSLDAMADSSVLDIPVGVALVDLQLMEAVEGHRKSRNGERIDFKHPAHGEAVALAYDDYKKDGLLDKLTPEKKYLITKLLLINTEVAEAVEAILEVGTDNPKTSQLLVVEEIADIVIRALGLKNEIEAAYPGHPGTSVAAAVAEKIVYNASRPHKHGNKLY